MMEVETTSTMLWPTPEESDEEKKSSSDDWEFISPLPTFLGSATKLKKMPHSLSTPDFGQYEFCDDSNSSSNSLEEISAVEVDIDCLTINSDEPVMITAASAPSVSATDDKPKVRRVPSFKDAILLNAQETVKEQANALERDKKSPLRRTRVKPRFVVQPIKRCAKSTGDLRSLPRISYEEEEEDMGGGGGGGGGSCVLGDTDAQEFYARKRHGQMTHKNGMKCRPDEAKRKEFIIKKKKSAAQRATA
mmetsp:Transcript_5681/g.8207  ORF Transcript_5681/g.8207 Transcript_5681/m.8207 type:complete len:248 (-) Transcript_5681:147-890(-)